MANLWNETISIMEENDRTLEDIEWIGSLDGLWQIELEVFERQARDYNYDNGYGSVKVPEDLTVVFSDGSWLERAEYDGAEWWEFKHTPALNPDAYKLVYIAR